MENIPDLSFQFGRYNSLTDLGIVCEVHEVLMPEKRARKVQIPGLSGMYDFGAETYDERTIVLDCKLIEQISKAKLREVVYKLSGKNKLYFWDEPEKYYVAELYDPTEVMNIADRLWLEFELTFICGPFAMSEVETQNLSVGANKIKYNGTVKTPTVVTLKNKNAFGVTNIVITVTRRR